MSEVAGCAPAQKSDALVFPDGGTATIEMTGDSCQVLRSISEPVAGPDYTLGDWGRAYIDYLAPLTDAEREGLVVEFGELQEHRLSCSVQVAGQASTEMEFVEDNGVSVLVYIVQLNGAALSLLLEISPEEGDIDAARAAVRNLTDGDLPELVWMAL